MAASEPRGWRLVVGDDDVVDLALVEASVHEELFHLNWCDQSRDGVQTVLLCTSGLGSDVWVHPFPRYSSGLQRFYLPSEVFIGPCRAWGTFFEPVVFADFQVLGRGRAR